MKRLYKYASGIALAGLLSLVLVPNANAQRGFHGGGHFRGGGGFRGGVGIGFGGIGFGFYGYPHFGYRIGYLPYGYYPFYFGTDLYYYYGGIFYRPFDGGGYEVAVPPVGAVVPGMPKGAKSIVIDGQQYYEFSGVYYQPSTDDKGKVIYIIAGKDGVLNTKGEDDNEPPVPQIGDIVNQLPDNCRKVSLNGKKYYVSPDGVYYEDFTDKQHNVKAYRIASVPVDGEQQN